MLAARSVIPPCSQRTPSHACYGVAVVERQTNAVKVRRMALEAVDPRFRVSVEASQLTGQPAMFVRPPPVSCVDRATSYALFVATDWATRTAEG